MTTSHSLEVDGSGRPRRRYTLDKMEDVPRVIDHVVAAVAELIEHKHEVVLQVRAVNDASAIQQRKLCALCDDMAAGARWYGFRLSSADWRHLVCAIIRRDQRQVPGEGGQGFILLGGSSRDLNMEEKAMAIELIYALGAERGVAFTDPKIQQQAAYYERASR